MKIENQVNFLKSYLKYSFLCVFNVECGRRHAGADPRAALPEHDLGDFGSLVHRHLQVLGQHRLPWRGGARVFLPDHQQRRLLGRHFLLHQRTALLVPLLPHHRQGGPQQNHQSHRHQVQSSSVHRTPRLSIQQVRQKIK